MFQDTLESVLPIPWHHPQSVRNRRWVPRRGVDDEARVPTVDSKRPAVSARRQGREDVPELEAHCLRDRGPAMFDAVPASPMLSCHHDIMVPCQHAGGNGRPRDPGRRHRSGQDRRMAAAPCGRPGLGARGPPQPQRAPGADGEDIRRCGTGRSRARAGSQAKRLAWISNARK